MDNKIIGIKQVTNEKWLNLYKLIYKTDDYIFVSRKQKQDLVAVKKICNARRNSRATLF